MSSEYIYFLSEQDGSAEKEFKIQISQMLENEKTKVRVYLTNIRYAAMSIDSDVAICFKIENGFDQSILEKTSAIFKKMFGSHERLDIIFLKDEQELQIRNVCFPFFISENYQVCTPDFYLTSSEGYDLQQVRSCFKVKKIQGSNPDGFLLCNLNPKIIGQKYNLGEVDITKVLLSVRHIGYTLFPVNEWPAYVQVARPIIESVLKKDFINQKDIEVIGWAEIYKKIEDIPAGL